MLAVVIFFIVFGLSWLWRRNNRNAKPPCYPGAWPILGHLPKLIGDSCHIWKVMNDFAKQSYDVGGVLIVKLGPKTVYCITDPDDYCTIVTTCLEKAYMYKFAQPWVGDGLITAGYSTWKTHRKLLNPAFSQTTLDTFMGIFNSQARKLVKELEKEDEKGLFDHSKYTQPNSLQTIGLTSLGVDLTNANLRGEYRNAIEEIMNTFTERMIKFWWHSSYTFAWSKLKKKQDDCLKILFNMSFKVLQNNKSKFYRSTSIESTNSGTKFKPFIDLLIELSLEKGTFNDREIREHVDTMLAAGHETTANTLVFTMMLLGSYPEVQEKVFAEIQEVLGEHRDVEKTDLSKLVYLEAVLKESLRLFPIGPILARITDRDVKLKNYTIPAGQTCALLLFALHKHPIWGPDAHEFHPERWLEPGRLPDNPNAYAPFSLGKRNCIGQIYAMMSLKTSLVHVVRRYRITADITKLRVKYLLVLKPDSGYYISIDKRRLIASYLKRKGYWLQPKFYGRRINKTHSTAPVKSVILWNKDRSVALVKTRLVIVSELPTEIENRIEKDLPENELVLLEPHQVAN